MRPIRRGEVPSSLMDRYEHLHAILCRFQRAISNSLSGRDIQRAATDLGIWQNGAMLSGSNNEMAALLDYAIYGLLDAKGETAVVRYARIYTQPQGSDDALILSAMTRSRYSLLHVINRVSGIGADCFDVFRRRNLRLVHHGLGLNAQAGLVLASRIISIDGYEISTGADLHVDADLFRLILDLLRQSPEAYGPGTRGIDESALIKACLDVGDADGFVHLNLKGAPVAAEELEPRAAPAFDVSPDRPCPCGSGQKYKRCCGRVA